MKDIFKFLIITSSVCLIHLHLNAENNKTTKNSSNTKASPETPAPTVTEVSPDNFRCEKFREGGISDLKLKMLENCDLNRPFSNSLSLFAGEETFLYCCHKKPTAN
jgi:hypothetical protein